MLELLLKASVARQIGRTDRWLETREGRLKVGEADDGLELGGRARLEKLLKGNLLRPEGSRAKFALNLGDLVAHRLEHRVAAERVEVRAGIRNRKAA